jgi:hypothetical protein
MWLENKRMTTCTGKNAKYFYKSTTSKELRRFPVTFVEGSHWMGVDLQFLVTMVDYWKNFLIVAALYCLSKTQDVAR